MFTQKMWRAILNKVVEYYNTQEIDNNTILCVVEDDLYIELDYCPTGWMPTYTNSENFYFRVPRQIWCPVVSSFGMRVPHYSKYTSNRRRAWKHRSYVNRINYYA